MLQNKNFLIYIHKVLKSKTGSGSFCNITTQVVQCNSEDFSCLMRTSKPAPLTRSVIYQSTCSKAWSLHVLQIFHVACVKRWH